ncbi:stimulated by retinoic acid gene 8 protein homolog [Microcaecilia unicolor]|uniref:Stimulated by retinoic acid gene 8 protein homolog n=1 Tax=Microcaecilia unicolor TaxID=1415580 RepID=A0A6P7Z7D7_9AMPH|nr:stimulated by retinoic acid gene 8 protein homolog [Microcaecilia unicolor]
MEASGARSGGSSSSRSGVSPGQQDAPQPRARGGRQRVTLAGLYGHLREAVCAGSDNPMSKWQILRKAKQYIQELEQTLDSLLKMKESFHLDDGNPSSLQEVKEEYISMFSNSHGAVPSLEPVSENNAAVWYLIKEYERGSVEEDAKPEPVQSPVTSSPDLMEFERYLYFYKQTVDLLVENRIVSPEEVTLPVVSKAISYLWQELPEERRASILQYCSQRENSLTCPLLSYQKGECAEGSVRDSGADSQEASGSLVSSTSEEILFEDAFDLASGFLDRGEMQGMSCPSSACEGCTWEMHKEGCFMYRQIVTFLSTHLCAVPQDMGLQFDYETVMLRCTETFDDEDL